MKDFLDPQLRAAKEKDLSACFDIRFDEAGIYPREATPRKSSLSA